MSSATTGTQFYTPLDSGFDKAKERVRLIYRNDYDEVIRNRAYTEDFILDEIRDAWIKFEEQKNVPDAFAELMLEFVATAQLIRLYERNDKLSVDEYVLQFRVAESMALSWEEIWKKIIEILDPRQ